MDLNEIMRQAKNVKAPGRLSGGPHEEVSSVDALIALMKAEDVRQQKLLRRMKFFYSGAAIIYLMIFVLSLLFPPDTTPESSRLVLGLFALIFLSLGGWSGMTSRKLQGIDYAAPVRAFLEQADARYRFIRPRDIALGIVYLAVLTITSGLAWSNAAQRYFPALENSVVIATFCLVWFVACIMGLVLGLLDWRKRKAPLLKELRRIRSELGDA